MTRRIRIGMLCLTFTVLMGLCHVSAAKKQPEAPLTAQGEKLLATYAQKLASLKKEIVASVPGIDEKKTVAFLAARTAFAKANASEDAKPEVVKQAEANALTAARAILADVDKFLTSDTRDARLIKCALLANATPRGLAEFAQRGKKQEALVEAFLGDDALMKQMLEAGGANGGKYGQSMDLYTEIQKASKHADGGIFQRFALGSALHYPKDDDTEREVKVKTYLNYEKAYLDGELDPAFKTLTTWEYRFIIPQQRSLEDVIWMRKMLRNYRPDHIANPDYKWRYIAIVRSDVPYGPARRIPGSELSHMQQILVVGGSCGPRAFTGKLSTAAFGIPTRGARQTGHAAMSHWTPDGWTVCLGAHWRHNWWDGRCGMDFLLETQARENPQGYWQVLRAQWIGDALGEQKVNGMRYGTGGGLWNVLAFYRKIAIVEDAKIAEVALTGEELAESNVSTKAEKIPQVEIPEADRKITVGRDGVITIPVAACASPTKSTEKIRFMKSIGGGIQLHYNLAGKRPELLRYTIQAPAAGKYQLAARVVTVTVDRSCLLRLNRRTLLDIALPYTCGMWKDTKPVTVALKEGRTTLDFTCRASNKGLTIKHFTLTPLGK